METFFYCQSCDAKITVGQLALLNKGRCPGCGTMEGFSSIPKSEGDPFEKLTLINDTELIEKIFSEDEE